MNSNKPAYVSLFSGAGGLDLGLEMAGWRTAYASDFDPHAVATLKANSGRDLGKGQSAFENTFVELADVTKLTGKMVRERAGLRLGDVELVAGGPPCQSWSSAGHQLGLADPRGRLFDDFTRISNELDARWLVIENVRGLLTARGPDGQPGTALQFIRSKLLKTGYQTAVGLLNAADFGVPQRRVRLFMFGFRSGDAPSFPLPTHCKRPSGGDILPWVSLRNAISRAGRLVPEEVLRPTGKLAIDLADIAPGSGVKSPGKAERTRPGGHWGYKQGAFVADLEQSARTVTANAQQDWVRDDELGLRRLCPRECAAIQTFPSDWHFSGSFVDQYRLIGNAVPPTLGYAIGRSLIDHVKAQPDSGVVQLNELLPLSDRLTSHVLYTAREERSNGPSRRAAGSRRVVRSSVG